MALNSVAAAASIVGPQILGDLVEQLGNGIDDSYINKAALIFLGALVVQTVFTRWARIRGAVLGESILADLREDFLTRVVALPPGVVERAGTGDLVTRTTTDVDRLSWAVRLAVPEISIAIVTATLVFAALVFTSTVACSVVVVCAAGDPGSSPGGTSSAHRTATGTRCRRTQRSTPVSPKRLTLDARSRRTVSVTHAYAAPTAPSSAG